LTGRLARRELAIAATALLAGSAAFAATEQTRTPAHLLPEAVGSYVALAGTMGPAALGRRTACGVLVNSDTEGVAHPTLPCGARIYLTLGSMTVLTQVIGHGPIPAGRVFDLTAALGVQLGLGGVRKLRWSYAAS
jgi:rare lipoprotein A (peptidoglycan hydrolase)